MQTVHRYRLKDGRPGEFVHPATQCNCVPLSRDGEVTLQPEWGDRAPSEDAWEDEDFDLKYFIVLDEQFCQPFVPFYKVMEGEEPATDYVAEVVSNYNRALDSCPWLERVS